MHFHEGSPSQTAHLMGMGKVSMALVGAVVFVGLLAVAMLCRGVDIILEMLANVNLSHDTKLLANNGRVIVIGSRGGDKN